MTTNINIRVWPLFQVGPFLVDIGAAHIRKQTSLLILTPTERDVLWQLLENHPEIIPCEEFNPWIGQRRALHQRHPVEEVIGRVRKKLVGVKIKKVRNTGYQLDPQLSVVKIAGSADDVLKERAVRQLNAHTRKTILAATIKYEHLVAERLDPAAFFNLALSYVNQGTIGFCVERPQVTIVKASVVHPSKPDTRGRV